MPLDNATLPAPQAKFLRLTAPQLRRVLRVADEQARQASQEAVAVLLCRLRDEGKLDAAIRLAARALPGREAVWWGVMCVEAVTPPGTLPPPEQAALRAVQAWVWRPQDDQLALAAIQAAQACQGTAAGSLGLAIGLNRRMGGNRGFAAGVEGAIVRLTPKAAATERLTAWRRAFIGSALDIAQGGAGRIAERLPA
jgi:hypothetical protein